LQGMNAILATWAHEQAQKSLQETSNIATDLQAKVWPEQWGTAGQPTEESPFARVFPDSLPDGWAARDQKQTKLSVPPTNDYTNTVCSPLGHDALVGFKLFEQYSHYATFRVNVPDFDPNEEYDGSYTRVPVGPVTKGFLSVAGVMMMGIMKDYVVRRL